MRVNIGCGQTPIDGWRNFDNSLSLKLARVPAVPEILARLGILRKEQREFIRFARENTLEFANAAQHLPLGNCSVDVLYSSHMLEHLAPEAAARFLREAFRVLRSGGTLRLAVPDLGILVSQYEKTGDADVLIQSMHVCHPSPPSLIRRIAEALIGPRHHQWMYDGASLCRLIERHGFRQATVMPAGTTMIPSPGNLNLNERAHESVYVEAKKD